jgi:hypothetical protein
MGILSDTISKIKEEVEKKEIPISEELRKEYEDYIINKLKDKKKGNEIIIKILNSIIDGKEEEINLLKVGINSGNVINQEIEKIKELLMPEKKPFQKDKVKYFKRYTIFFIATLITVIILIVLLILPIFYREMIENSIFLQISYRISILIPFSMIIALFIYQFQNALKHYHKACEAIHVMGSYPAIIKTISINEQEKEKVNARLFEILFDWHPRPNEWKSRKKSISSMENIMKAIKDLKDS